VKKPHTDLTYFYDRWRSVAAGITETAGQTFILLAAVRILQAGPTAKALLAAGGSVGFILSLATVAVAGHRRWVPSQTAAWLSLAGACAMAMAGLFPILPVFVPACMIGMATSGMLIPLLTHMYESNYHESDRGRRYSRTIIIRIITAMLFSWVAGWIFAAHPQGFRWLMAIYAAAFVFSGWCLWRVPMPLLSPEGGAHPFRAMRYVREDRVFRLTLISWMLMGFANLMMIPMRVEYLANTRYGLDLSTAKIALLVGVIPNITRLIMIPIWGSLFDRMNFFNLRVAVNMGFALGIVTFFTSNSLPGLVAGALVFGISNAGGDVAWNLWVTKFAPEGRVADYMSVHVFLTGLRGIVAPLVAFHIVSRISIGALGWFSAVLIIGASAILVRELYADRERAAKAA
jgi:MFS family permease